MEEAVRRVLDVVLGFILLILSLPVIAVAVAVIRLSSKGPAILAQPRVGLNGRVFKMYKLRTMYWTGDLETAAETEPRVIPLCSAFRKFSIDELPQFLSVIRGDMSLVGPRPDEPRYVAAYPPEGRRRFAVKPGMTGLHQIECRRSSSWQVGFRWDMEYIARRSLWFDVWILLRTIPAVLSGKDAS